MIRSLVMVAVLAASAGGAFAADAWSDLIGVKAQIAREMSRIDTILAYQDLADRIAILFGQSTAADADTRLKTVGEWFLRNEVGEADLAEARARAGAAIDAYLNAASQAASASNAWPGGPAQQAEARRLLEAVRSSYPRFLQSNLDPTLLVMQAALVVGWSRGETAVANPFAGHLQRMNDAYPHPRTRARIAAATAPLVAPDGTTVVTATPYSPPVRQPIQERTEQATPGGQWVGCFRDANKPFDLDGHLERSPANTPQACIAKCGSLGFRFAGLQYGESCLCGNSYGRYGAADNCNYPCTGDAGQICGGHSANSIYTTGAQGAPMHPPLPEHTDPITDVQPPGGEIELGVDELSDAGLELDTDRPGMDLASFDLESADPVLCLVTCQDYGGCRAFVYVKPGIQGPAARCLLKSGVPAAVRSPCCISGTP